MEQESGDFKWLCQSRRFLFPRVTFQSLPDRRGEKLRGVLSTCPPDRMAGWCIILPVRGESPMAQNTHAESIVRDVKRRTRKKCSSEEKIRIVLEGLRGETSVAELCLITSRLGG